MFAERKRANQVFHLGKTRLRSVLGVFPVFLPSGSDGRGNVAVHILNMESNAGVRIYSECMNMGFSINHAPLRFLEIRGFMWELDAAVKSYIFLYLEVRLPYFYVVLVLCKWRTNPISAKNLED